MPAQAPTATLYSGQPSPGFTLSPPGLSHPWQWALCPRGWWHVWAPSAQPHGPASTPRHPASSLSLAGGLAGHMWFSKLGTDGHLPGLVGAFLDLKFQCPCRLESDWHLPIPLRGSEKQEDRAARYKCHLIEKCFRNIHLRGSGCSVCPTQRSTRWAQANPGSWVFSLQEARSQTSRGPCPTCRHCRADRCTMEACR